MAGVLVAIHWFFGNALTPEKSTLPDENSAVEPAAGSRRSVVEWVLRTREPVSHRIAGSCVALAGVVAIWLAFGFRVGFSVWPEDAWARIPVATAIVGIGAIVTNFMALPPARWVVRGFFVYEAVVNVIPTGEGWEFLEPNLVTWKIVMVSGVLLSWIAISNLRAGMACGLGFGWIFCIAASAFLGQDFLRVAELMFAIASVVGCVAIATGLKGTTCLTSVVAGPMVFALVAALASVQFNSFLGLPDALFGFAILCPALGGISVMLAAVVLRRWVDRSKLALLIPLIVSLILSAGLIYWTLAAGGGPPSEEDDWAFEPAQLTRII